MGLFDWLNEAMGASGGGSSMPPLPQADNLPTRPMPPVQGPMDQPSLNPETGMGAGPPPGPNMMAPMPPGGDPMQAGGLNAGGLPPPSPPVPMPQPRPPGAPGPQVQPPAPAPQQPPMPPIPPPGNGTNGVGPGLGVASPAALAGSPQARTILGRALGLDPNSEMRLRGSLAAGLKAAGENSNKGKGAAFMGSAGSAMEGGVNADNKTTEQQDKVLGRAIQSKTADQAATNAGFNNRLSEARTKLAEEQTKMAKAGGKDSVMNSQSQLYLRAIGLVNNDPEVKLAKSTYDNAIKTGDSNSPEVKAAKKAHEDLVKAKTAAHFANLGIDPKVAEKLGKQPGMSQDNPVDTKGMTQDKLNALPPGSFIKAPDGRVLQKKADAGPAAGANQPAPTQSMTPAVQPPIPPAVANAQATMGADDEDE